MQAVVIDNHCVGIDERTLGPLGPGSVVVRTAMAGVNAADLLQRDGYYPAPAGWPTDIPGLEVAGIVDQVGDEVDASLQGQRVCAIVGGGAQAAFVVVPAAHLLVVPPSISWAAAGGFAEAYLTAYDALVRQARLAPGDRVLISGASGGVGNAACNIARLVGAHVVALTRHAAHHEELLAMGAHEILHPDQLDTVTAIDVHLELVGASILEVAQYQLAPFSRVVVIGVGGGGRRASVDLRHLMGLRATLTGSTLRSRGHDEKVALVRQASEFLLPAWANGQLRTREHVMDATDVDAAYALFQQPGKLGKIVLRFDETL